ncbi:endonuclease/exonuclease/phosphatase family protein [Desulfotruncus alcoholivorax]|uniref:endonuclease/exonuclease/phosphatase family protein n=1 Tax=Desulfotruncus alcoholivorax TaxID=265477 RepID=UPI0003FAC539|nr:endonuclease/exonuclease/phosphatase family protein [Desulfotruncus alcoholivorax]
MKLTVVTYNIKNGMGINGEVSLPAIASTIASTGAVIAGLQEVDYLRPRSGFKIQYRKLGQMLSMQSAFGPTITCLGLPRFGNAVLSIFPISECVNYPLPSKWEKRCLLKVKIKTDIRDISFFCVHLGLNQLERIKQVKKIIEYIGNETGPLILAGDFNAKPESDEIKKIKTLFQPVDPEGLWPTFPANKPEHKIDYIFYSAHWKLIKPLLINSQASDHLPLGAEFELNY